MDSRDHQDWEPDVYGDPTEARQYNGMGWVGMTPEERAEAKADPMTAKLIERLERVIDGWAL